jgi:hypothetical protein
MNRRRRAQLTVALCALILLVPVGIAAAQVATHSATAGVTYETNSNVAVTLGDQHSISNSPFDDTQTFNSSGLRVSGSDADVRVTDNTFNSYPITVRNVDVSGSLTVERTDLNKQLTVESGDASLLQVRDYQLDDGTEDLAYSSSNGLTVTLSGLPNVNVAVVEAGTGNPIDEVAASSGEATINLPSGTNSIRLETAPGDLEVRNEARPNQLIDGNVTLRARLFSDDGAVVERQVTNGTVSLDGVPKDEELVVTVKEESADYTYRRILLDSAIESSEIYLLPTTDPSAEIEFQLQDETGRFDNENTKLFVEKPIQRDYDGDGTNETRYQPISGDRIGGDGSFPTILQSSERYRLRVENDAGEQRVLGSYTVTGAERTVLPIGEVTFREDVDEGAALQASLREAADGASYDHEIRLVYVDPEAKTESIDISITDSNGGTIRPASTENLTGVDRYVETYPIRDSSFDPEQDTATVTVEALRNNQIETFERSLGNVPDVFTNVPLSTQAIEVISLASIVAVGGLVVIISAPMAALVTTGYAGMLSLVGLAPIPMPAVVLAGVVGVVATVGSRRI